MRPAPIRSRSTAATLYLPTRRACRLARDVFLDVLDSDAALLPRIVPIGDIDEDEIAFAEIATGAAAADALDLPPALGGLTRRMLLAQLVLLWAQRLKPAPGDQPLVVGTPAAALALADDLARLMDDLATREVDWSRLDGLVPEHVDTLLAAHPRFPQDRARARGRTSWPSARRSSRPSGATG